MVVRLMYTGIVVAAVIATGVTDVQAMINVGKLGLQKTMSPQKPPEKPKSREYDIEESTGEKKPDTEKKLNHYDTHETIQPKTLQRYDSPASYLKNEVDGIEKLPAAKPLIEKQPEATENPSFLQRFSNFFKTNTPSNSPTPSTMAIKKPRSDQDLKSMKMKLIEASEWTKVAGTVDEINKGKETETENYRIDMDTTKREIAEINRLLDDTNLAKDERDQLRKQLKEAEFKYERRPVTHEERTNFFNDRLEKAKRLAAEEAAILRTKDELYRNGRTAEANQLIFKTDKEVEDEKKAAMNKWKTDAAKVEAKRAAAERAAEKERRILDEAKKAEELAKKTKEAEDTAAAIAEEVKKVGAMAANEIAEEVKKADAIASRSRSVDNKIKSLENSLQRAEESVTSIFKSIHMNMDKVIENQVKEAKDTDAIKGLVQKTAEALSQDPGSKVLGSDLKLLKVYLAARIKRDGLATLVEATKTAKQKAVAAATPATTSAAGAPNQ